MTRINKETSLCISVAERPSNFGTTVFNEAFEAADIDFIYKACKLDTSEKSLSDAIAGIRAIGIRGCGVSMPFKTMAVKYMDRVDESVSLVGALNTISNESGDLVGYNTDYYGAKEALGQIKDIQSKKVLLLGGGGVAMAISAALRSLGVCEVMISNKTPEKAVALAEKWSFDTIPWELRNDVTADLLINATSIGMQPETNEMPIEVESLANFEIVYDVVISPVSTKLLLEAASRGLGTIPGSIMCLHQAIAQYEIYTGTKAPVEVMERAMNKLMNQ